MLRLVFLFSLVSVVAGLVPQHYGGSFTFELKDNEKLCFYQPMDQEAEYELDYRVVEGGNNDVDVKVIGPDKRVLYEKIKGHDDQVKLKIHPGLYEFCFSNEFSTITHKQVYLALYPTSPVTLKQEAGEELKPGVDTLMESLLEDIHRHSTDFENLQADQQSEGLQSFNIASALNTKIQHWSIGVAVVVILSSLGQVFFLKKLFDSKTTIQPNMSATHF